MFSAAVLFQLVTLPVEFDASRRALVVLRIDFKGYRADCINDFALEYLDQYDGKKPFFMTVSQIEPHHQNDHNHYEGPKGSKEKYANFVLPHDLEVLKGNAAEEYPDYLGQCASLDENLGRLVAKLKEKGLYENTIIIYASDHGSHFKTRNTDSHLNGYDDYNGIIIAASSLLEPVYEKMFKVTHINKNAKLYRVFQIIRTFILVNIGWFFDDAANLKESFVLIKNVFVNFKIGRAHV